MDAGTIAGIVTGSIGSITGVLSLSWNIVQSRPKILLKSSWITQEEDGMEIHTLKMINRRDKPVKIESYGFMSKKGGKYRYMPIAIAEIPGNDNVAVYWTIDDLADEFDLETRRSLNRLYVEDGEGIFTTLKIR